MGDGVLTRRLRWTAAAVVVVAVAVGGWWWLFRSGAVRFPGEGSFGITVPAATAGPYTAGSMTLCLEGVDSAVVDEVTVDDGGLAVTDFAVRPRTEWPQLGLGTTQQALRSTGFGDGRTITGRCADHAGSELGVELTKPTSATARTDVLVVHWSSGIRSGTVEVPMHLVLCAGEPESNPECAYDR
jgi:hypothetical protein